MPLIDPVEPRTDPAATATASHPRRPSRSARPWLEAARALGRSLCASAHWDAERRECNWIGHRDIEDRLTAPYSTRAAALSPELYSGSSGVAWFLGELWSATGDPELRETALGALRRSVRYVRDHPSPAYPLSLYAGHLGLLWVAVRLGELDPELDLQEECAWLFDHAEAHLDAPHPYDVIGGNAGAILGLLRVGRTFRPEACETLAARLAGELCRAADWEGDACSWQATEGFAQLPPMTGYSHGASGIATALLCLHRRTGDPELLRTARGAFAFEDGLYDDGEKNWVDTRYPYRRVEGRLEGRFRERWCHGAPGISLARALAVRLDPVRAAAHRRMATAALETTASALEACADVPGHDATLCHGVAGLAEILAVAGELLGATGCEQGTWIVEDLVGRYAGPWNRWPSGLGTNGPTPCLMVGAAGVGFHLLRLAGVPDLSSPLLLLPD